MKRFKLIISGISLILNVAFLNGQREYKNGYVIFNTNDTVVGLINLASNYQNHHLCNFKKNSESVNIQYTPQDIRSFRIENNKYYISHYVTIDSTKTKVFLEMLLDGIVDLYYYKSIEGEFYFIEKDSVLFLLANESKEIVRNNVKYKVYTHQYRGILSYIFKESPETVARIKSTSFSYRSLIKISKNYHERVCTEYECVDFTRTTRPNVYIEPNVGFGNSWMGYKSSNDLASDYSTSVGVNLRLSSIKLLYRWNFIVGLNYSENYFVQDYDHVLNDRDVIYHVNLSYGCLQVPLMAEYSFSSKKFQPVCFAGYNNCFILNPDYAMVKTFPVNASDPYTRFFSYQLGFLGGIGARYNITPKANVYGMLRAEYRMPSAVLAQIQDNHFAIASFLHFGYSYKIQ